ncbi:hypothetical protein EVAR_51875_1 [Eumeta japonica]|uniref:Uncharacterized protein n=1 Tax=Eumeta variegata TaxID=151549 RepID=A0A4C1YI14_EUMVA|nr:hypothetical protein EVAR_51875_1 [Eumeta japonica]
MIEYRDREKTRTPDANKSPPRCVHPGSFYFIASRATSCTIQANALLWDSMIGIEIEYGIEIGLRAAPNSESKPEVRTRSRTETISESIVTAKSGSNIEEESVSRERDCGQN